MHTFTLNVITSGRQEITVQKDREYNRVTVRVRSRRNRMFLKAVNGKFRSLSEGGCVLA
jgi:hypothetical protein